MPVNEIDQIWNKSKYIYLYLIYQMFINHYKITVSNIGIPILKSLKYHVNNVQACALYILYLFCALTVFIWNWNIDDFDLV